MSIDTSGGFAPPPPEDIKEFLEAYTEDERPSEEFSLSKFNCGSIAFGLLADDIEGTAKRICR